jgi:8-oxo-dGTP diphosphatase
MENNRIPQAGAWAVIYCPKTSKVLLGKRSSKMNKGGAWNLFGGCVDDGERPREALVRELEEEAGLNVAPRHLSKLDTVTRKRHAGKFGRKMHYYVAKANREFTPCLNREHSDFGWFKMSQLPTKFNAPTLVAIKKGFLDKAVRGLNDIRGTAWLK